MIRLWGLAAACAIVAAACQPDTCNDIDCVMNSLALTDSTGARVPLYEVPTALVPIPQSYTPSPSALPNSIDLLIMPVSMPNLGDPLEIIRDGWPAHAGSGSPDEGSMPTITNQPDDLHFTFPESIEPLELDITDPNAETPAFFIVPADPARGIIFSRCVWMAPSYRDGRASLQDLLKLQQRTFVDFAQSGFWLDACSTLPPMGSRVLPLGPLACPTGTKRCDDDSCIPAAMDCTPGAGVCGPMKHWCGNDCVPFEQTCCTFDSMDVSCCPNGPNTWPCLPPVVAGPPVRVNASLAIAPDSSGGGGGTSGGGGGGGGGGSGGGSCPGGQLGSARFCIQDGTSNSCSCNVDASQVSMCITPQFWQQYFGTPFPPMCAAQGSSCVASDGRTMTTYCCPGLSCIGAGGPACGSGQGTCQPHS